MCDDILVHKLTIIVLAVASMMANTWARQTPMAAPSASSPAYYSTPSYTTQPPYTTTTYAAPSYYTEPPKWVEISFKFFCTFKL